MTRTWLDLVDRLLPEREELERVFGVSDASPREPDDVLHRFGCSLWQVFSDNHAIVGADGAEAETGTFRSVAGDIADALNQRYPWRRSTFGYMDFYMGHPGEVAGAAQSYRWIFSMLKEQGCDWRYSFPRVYLVDLGAADTPAMTEYDPSEAVRAELERETSPTAELAADLDRLYEEAVERARDRPLPATVEAYREVYGRLPDGWPH